MNTFKSFLAGLILTGILAIAPNIALAHGGGGGGGGHFGGGGGHFGGGHGGGFHAGFGAHSGGNFHGSFGGGRYGGYGFHHRHYGYFYPYPFVSDYDNDGYLDDYSDQYDYDGANDDLQATPTPSMSSELTFSVQKELTGLGYYHGPLDGVIGPETEAAVRWFQSVDKLPVTGEINDVTLRALGIS